MSIPANGWQAGLCDPGEDGDCPRSCFIGCDQFGRTRYRLDQTCHNKGDPMDMSKYKGCNKSCWDYCLLCFGGLYIGSGVYTGQETSRIRKRYGIPGNYADDIAKGIFCQPCSLIRNENEVRKRESQNHELRRLGPPMPLGENNFESLYTMPANQPYCPEPNMTAVKPNKQRSGSGRREVHFHEEPGGPRMVPLYPTDQELQDPDHAGQLPPIPSVGSSLSIADLGRRGQALTPISERDSAEDSRSQLKENRSPKVQNWLQSMGFPPGDKSTAEKGLMAPGPGNPPTMVSQSGQTSPEPSSSPKPRKKSSLGKSLKHKKQLEEAELDLQPAVDASEILLTPSAGPGDEEPNAAVHDQAGLPDKPREGISSPPVIHTLSTEIQVPGPSATNLKYGIKDDARATSPKSIPPDEHNLSAGKRVSFLSLTDPEHNLSSDERVEFLKFTENEHRLRRERRVTLDEPSIREHRTGTDRRMTLDDGPLREYSLGADKLVDTAPSEEFPWLKQPPQAHSLPEGMRVEASSRPPQEHEMESEIRVPAMERLQAQEHRLSKDKRVQSPAPKGPFTHGIHLDERVPPPELLWNKLEHNILQDRQVLSPSPVVEEHDLHADERIELPALYPPSEHDIRSDQQVAEPSEAIQQHGLEEDAQIASSPQKKATDHPISGDNKVAQRAYQLLEHFLEQDRKAPNRSDKSRSRG